MPVHDWSRVDAGIFHDFYTAWIGEIRKALNGGLLPADYYALAEAIAGDIGQDVLTLQHPMERRGDDILGDAPSAVAVATVPPQVQWTLRAEDETYRSKQRTLAIRHRSGHRLIAIVSPGNKSSRHAFEALVAKLLMALDQGIHVLLIDLQKPSPRDPEGIHNAIWEELNRKCPPTSL